jgi:ubiquinol-cytochrome c reductase iron-sulfur subunit
MQKSESSWCPSRRLAVALHFSGLMADTNRFPAADRVELQASPVAHLKRQTVAEAKSSPASEPTRRDMLFLATGAMGAAGVVALAVPFVRTLAPNAQTIAAGAPIEVDLTPIPEGQGIKLFWRGKLIFVRSRTKAEIDEAQKVNLASLPDPQADSARVKPGKENWLVLYGSCTHLGCIPAARLRARCAATTTAGSALAMGRTTTPRAASAKARRRATCPCPPMPSCPTPRSVSADLETRESRQP